MISIFWIFYYLFPSNSCVAWHNHSLHACLIDGLFLPEILNVHLSYVAWGMKDVCLFYFILFSERGDWRGLSYVACYFFPHSYLSQATSCAKEYLKEKQKWMQHRDFPGGHPSQYYSGPKALNFRVLMGSGVVALV